MSIRRTITEPDGIFFITFTCYKWLRLIDIAQGYDIVYNQFDHLKKDGHYILGYVIMPNHVHALLGYVNTGKTINARVGTMKRFMAYEIVARLQKAGQLNILKILEDGVNATDKSKGKRHEVFEPSFDCKLCYDRNMINTKLDYIHNNPCAGKWSLVESPVDYVHSSAKYYMTGEQGIFPVTNYMILEDVDLTKPRSHS